MSYERSHLTFKSFISCKLVQDCISGLRSLYRVAPKNGTVFLVRLNFIKY